MTVHGARAPGRGAGDAADSAAGRLRPRRALALRALAAGALAAAAAGSAAGCSAGGPPPGERAGGGSNGARGSTAPGPATLPGPRAALPPALRAADPPGTVPSGQPFTGLPQVGALFSGSDDAAAEHYCSASVVASPAGDLVVTAAHCVWSDGAADTGIAFAPGYHDGQYPYGVWTVTHVYVDPAWAQDADPDDDFAFLTVARAGSAVPVQSVVGADELSTSPPYTARATVVGYPDDTEEPVWCTHPTTEFSSTQLEFDCAAFPDGTSGGPFLLPDPHPGGVPLVVGVIGGYQAGGNTPDISYSAYFGPTTAALYALAAGTG